MNGDLQDIKVGDTIAVRLPAGWSDSDNWQYAKVSKVTKTQVVVTFGNSEKRFRRDSGREVGADRWHWANAYPLTPENRKEVEENIAETRERRAVNRAINTIRDAKLKDLPTELLLSIAQQITEALNNSQD